jgi:oxygen-independent coproporphyrinogen-3 oxidase
MHARAGHDSIDGKSLRALHAGRGLLFGAIAELLDPERPVTLRSRLRRLERGRLGGGSQRALTHLSAAAGMLEDVSIVEERGRLLAGELGEVSRIVAPAPALAARPARGARPEPLADAVTELRGLERMAESCAAALERGDVAGAADSWTLGSRALAGALGARLVGVAAQLEGSASPFFREVGQALRALVDEGALAGSRRSRDEERPIRSGAFPEVTEALVARYDVPGPRYTSYPPVPAWRDDFGPDDHAEHLARASQRPDAPLALYVHLPFCEERCTYCGCNVVVTGNRARADEYLDHLAMELALVAERLRGRRRANALHWGGGTPTFLAPAQLERLWRMIGDRFSLEDDAEVAIELDPRVTTLEQLRLLRRLGFNRVSLGVQDLDPDVQAAVKRRQTFEALRSLVTSCREVGFASVNFDLIYGLPQQTPSSWSRTLEQVLSLRPDRLAVYSFAFVPEARPHQRRLALLPMPRGVAKLSLFRHAYESFVAAGYVPIGMDHFALFDDELAVAQRAGRLTRNFQGYTASADTEVVAFGASAISDVGGGYAQNAMALPRYQAAVASGRLATVKGLALGADDQLRRRVIRDLMCNHRAELSEDEAASLRPALTRLATSPDLAELAEVAGRSVELSPLGKVFVRNVAMAFDATSDGASTGFSRTV